MATIALTEKTFVEALDRQGILLIDWWAAWCGPCRTFGPIYEKVSERHGDVRFAKIDVDAEPGLAQGFGIQSIPTLTIIRDGVLLFNQAGAIPEGALEQLIDQTRSVDMAEVQRRVAEMKEAELEESDEDDDEGDEDGGGEPGTRA